MWEAVLGEHHPDAVDNGEQIMKVGKYNKLQFINIHQINRTYKFYNKTIENRKSKIYAYFLKTCHVQ